MMPMMPTHRVSLKVWTLVAAGCVALALGCGSGNSQAPQASTTSATVHPSDWLTAHPAAFFNDRAQCTPCHGSYTVAADSGGTSQVSCFQCHHPNGPVHPDGWGDSGQHGLLGAMAAPGSPVTAGMAYCTTCHGSDFKGATDAGPSCYQCHTTAPHPPDTEVAWLTDTSTSHSLTNPANVATCITCHYRGANSNLIPDPPAASTTEPGCFNATMCHSSTKG